MKRRGRKISVWGNLRERIRCLRFFGGLFGFGIDLPARKDVVEYIKAA